MSRKKHRAPTAPKPGPTGAPDVTPDWTKPCEVCGAKPVLRDLGMCGPCTFGESGTAGGNW
ncbi:MAG: hypothetical protein EPO40_06135 [Myxococcaceae bacterium]|nr:MAG: hypothetical protein EPO40_06135 [Myxococcaceae bacterium]